MTFPVCPDCGSELGPWEARTCLSHRPGRPAGDGTGHLDGLTIADLAVMVLEREQSPVSTYDVQRSIGRALGRPVLPQSVTAVMGADHRFCWSGKGIYGLFRHDRIPRVRTLSGVSRVILAVHAEPLRLSELSFVLKWAGYRFQDVSLEAALLRDSATLGFTFAWVDGDEGPEYAVQMFAAREWRRSLEFELRPLDRVSTWPTDDLLDRWQRRVGEGIAERARRLRRAGAKAVRDGESGGA